MGIIGRLVNPPGNFDAQEHGYHGNGMLNKYWEATRGRGQGPQTTKEPPGDGSANIHFGVCVRKNQSGFES